MSTALLLIALGFGFKIYVEASRTTKANTKRLGRIVAIFIMVLAATGALCHTAKSIRCGLSAGCAKSGYFMGIGGKKCPLNKKLLSAAESK